MVNYKADDYPGEPGDPPSSDNRRDIDYRNTEYTENEHDNAMLFEEARCRHEYALRKLIEAEKSHEMFLNGSYVTKQLYKALIDERDDLDTLLDNERTLCSEEMAKGWALAKENKELRKKLGLPDKDDAGPCCYCRSENLVFRLRNKGQSNETHFIECLKCGMTGPNGDSKESASSNWKMLSELSSGTAAARRDAVVMKRPDFSKLKPADSSRFTCPICKCVFVGEKRYDEHVPCPEGA